MSDMWDEVKGKGLGLPAVNQQPEKLMTGQEWYEKFRIEFRKLAPMSYAKDFYAKKAARKVAGIKEDMDG